MYRFFPIKILAIKNYEFTKYFKLILIKQEKYESKDSILHIFFIQ